MAGLSCLVFLAITVTNIQVQAYPGGGPDGACDSLTPLHNAAPQTGASPFQIKTSASSIAPGARVEVSLSGSTRFMGFFVRIKQNERFIGGTFEVNEVGSPRCNGQGLTHSNPTPKSSVTFTWVAPADLSTAPVTVVATFVQEKVLFWTNIQSPELTVTRGSPGSVGGVTSSPGANSNMTWVVTRTTATAGNSGSQSRFHVGTIGVILSLYLVLLWNNFRY